MSEYNKYDFASLRNELLRAQATCDERVRITIANEAKYVELIGYKETCKEQIENTVATANHMNKLCKSIKFFLENKKNHSKTMLEDAIHEVSNIVPDADLTDCTILHENGKTIILNDKGQSIADREGSASMSTMGLLLKYVCIRAVPNKMQIMFLDEALPTLSVSSIVNIKDLVKEMSKHVGIVGIEQRDTLYAGIATRKYRATKTNGYSKIEEEVVSSE